MALPLQHARLDAEQIAAAANASELPAAIVCNAHITGLAVARSLARRGVPVIGLDREPYGVALASQALVAAAVCQDPISQEEEFIEDVKAIGAHLTRPAVLFGCMDEWVLALSGPRSSRCARRRTPAASCDHHRLTRPHCHREECQTPHASNRTGDSAFFPIASPSLPAAPNEPPIRDLDGANIRGRVRSRRLNTREITAMMARCLASDAARGIADQAINVSAGFITH